MSDSFAAPWTVACQAPLSMGFPIQEYWSGLSSPSPGDLPDSGIELMCPALQADSLPLGPWETPPLPRMGLKNEYSQPSPIFFQA